jgi:hypothetical protein
MRSDWVIPTPSDGWAGIQPEPRYYSKEGMAGQGISALQLYLDMPLCYHSHLMFGANRSEFILPVGAGNESGRGCK